MLEAGLVSVLLSFAIDDDEPWVFSSTSRYAAPTPRHASSTPRNAYTTRLWSGFGLAHGPRNARAEVTKMGLNAEEEVRRETQRWLHRHGETSVCVVLHI